MRHIRILGILALVALMLLISGCEERLSPEEIAAKIQEKQASINDYSGKMQITTYTDGEKDLEEIQVMYKKPNLVKAISVEDGNQTVSVADGEFLWSYDAGTNTVMKMRLPEAPLLKEMDMAGFIADFLNESEVSVLGSEDVDGRSTYVLESRPKVEKNEPILISHTKIWVDKETWMLLRSNVYDNKGNLIVETEINDLKINTGIPDSEFKFNIPDGAKIRIVDMGEELKPPEPLNLVEAKQKSSFEILAPEYIPEGYIFDYATVSNNSNLAPEGKSSETVILSYKKGNESFEITETIYESEPEKPVAVQEAESIEINGNEGKYFDEFPELKMVQWKLGEVEITLTGPFEKAEMLKIAESIQEPFTEFYVLGPEGRAENYPTEFVLGESKPVIVGITNQEQRPVNYSMEIKLENTPLSLPEESKNIFVKNNETLEKTINITPSIQGKNLKLNFLLYNKDKKDLFGENGSIPYRNLHLWISVS